MSADYRVDLTVGPYSWSVNRGDAPALPVVLDGLTVHWQFPDSNLWPSQHEPLSTSFSIVAEAVADLDAIDLGSPVLLRIWAGVDLDGTEYDSITFTGTVAELNGAPITFGHPLTGLEHDGWRLDVAAVDLTADLGEYVVQGVEFGGAVLYEGAQGWAQWIFGQSGLASPISGYEGQLPSTYSVSKIHTTDPAGGTALEPGSVGDAVEALFTYAVDAGVNPASVAPGQDPAVNPADMSLYYSHGWRRMILRPNTDAAGVVDPTNPYRIEYVSRRYGDSPDIGPAGPAIFAAVGGGQYGIVLDPPPASVVIGGIPTPVYDATVVIDAGYVSYDAAWVRSKAGDPNQVTVATAFDADRLTLEGVTPWTDVTASTQEDGEQLISAAISGTRLSKQTHARFAAEMYLDDDGPIKWAAAGFRWFASDDPSWPINRALFPGAALFGDYAAPIVINGIPDAQRPNAADWYTGTLKGATWTFDSGGFYLDLDLYPRTPRPIVAANVGLTWADLASGFPAVTWNNLDPSDTWVDYRLARSALYA